MFPWISENLKRCVESLVDLWRDSRKIDTHAAPRVWEERQKGMELGVVSSSKISIGPNSVTESDAADRCNKSPVGAK